METPSIPRLRTQEIEAATLSGFACQAARSAGRELAETPCSVRTDFQRDVDRIIHSKAFRRLMYKTQVFLCPEGDHYRTRLTHAMEVSRIARTIARGLRLNEDLTEAIALGHDLGHAPFGHAGERALNGMLPGGFAHNKQSRRVAEVLEKNGRGLNLTLETRDGLECHSGERRAMTLEGRIVALADRIAYINHDLDDAVRAGLLTEDALPRSVREVLGDSYSMRINTLTRNAIDRSDSDIRLDAEVDRAMGDMRVFMFERVYTNPSAKGEESKAIDMIRRMFSYYAAAPGLLPAELQPIVEIEGPERATADYISGMTDRYFLEKATELFLPHGWEKR